jgi:hypothetical protein
MPIRIRIRFSILMPIQIRTRIRIRVLTQVTQVGNKKYIFPYFAYIKASLHCFIFLFSVTGFKTFNILDSILKGFLLNIWLKQIRIRIGRPWMAIRVGSSEMMPIRPYPDPKHWLKYCTISLFDKTLRCRLWTVL